MPDSDETAYRGGPSAPEPEEPRAGLPRVGDVLAEKYCVERVLGVGGMGVVVAVTHLQLGERYAIKCLLPDSARDPETLARFMREARAAVRIKSEHIARVSDVGQLADGSPYILMEHLIGKDLSEVIADNGPLHVRDAVEYVLQACAGIAEAHALGIVHRDLKPSNLFLTQRLDGEPLVKVLDFGISKVAAEQGPHTPSLTQTSSVFGSPAYMSPEQVRSAKNVDSRTDVWSLGVILHELLAREGPFIADNANGLLAAIIADEPRPLRAVRPDVTEALEAVVRRCLEKNVQKRFQSVAELASALKPFRSELSRVSIGRMLRLTGAPALPLAQLAARDPSSSPSSLRGAPAGTATESEWTTGIVDPKRGRVARRVAGGLTLAVLLVGGVLYSRFAPVALHVPKAAVAPTPTETTGPVPFAPPAVLAVPAAGEVTAASSASSASSPGRAAPKRPLARQPGSPNGPAVATPPVKPVVAAPPDPAVTAAPAPPTTTTRDPFDTSH